MNLDKLLSYVKTIDFDNGTVVIKEYLKSKSWKVKQLAEENMLHR